MKRFVKLLHAEMTKLMRRRVTLVFVIAIVLIPIASVVMQYAVERFINNQVEQVTETSSEDGTDVTVTVNPLKHNEPMTRPELELRLNEIKDELNFMRQSPQFDEKDSDYISLNNHRLVMETYLENDLVPPSGSHNLWDSLTSNPPAVTLMVALVVILAVTVAAEYSAGTMKQLIIRPYSRTQILMSKFCSTMILGFGILILHALIYGVAYGLAFGFDLSNETLALVWMGKVFLIPQALQAILVHILTWLSLVLTVSFAMLIAVLTRSQAATIALSVIFAMMLPGIASSLSPFVPWLSALPVVFTSLSPILQQGINATSLGSLGRLSDPALSYGLNQVTLILGWLGYSALFIALSLLKFRRSDF